MQPISAGFSLFLIVLGAILRYAVTWDPEGVDLDVIGLILIIAGAVGLCIWLIWFLVSRSDRQREQYESQGHPYYSSARLWDDGVIDPVDTRRVLSFALAAAMNRTRDTETPFGIFRM